MSYPKQPGQDAEAHLAAVHKVLELMRENKRLREELKCVLNALPDQKHGLAKRLITQRQSIEYYQAENDKLRAKLKDYES